MGRSSFPIQFLVVGWTTCLFVLGCGDRGQFDASSFDQIPERELTGVLPDTPEKSVCYGTQCLPTIALDAVVPVNKDYIYPDPEDYPTVDLRPLYVSPIALIDLTTVDLTSNISPNFSFSDYMSPQKGRYGLFSPFVAEQMQKMRESVKRAVFVHSGYRSPGYNARQNGSADWSRHTYGDAVDFEISGKRISALPDICKKFSASFTLTYRTHVHCDWRLGPKDQNLFPPQMRPEAFGEFDLASIAAIMSRIELQKKNEKWVLSTVVVLDGNPHAEGELTHEWTISSPKLAVIRSTESEVVVVPTPGEMHVEVIVGGSIRLERTILW